MYGNIPDARNVMFGVWRDFEEIRIDDASFYLRLNHSRLVTSKLRWRPEIRSEVVVSILILRTEININCNIFTNTYGQLGKVNCIIISNTKKINVASTQERLENIEFQFPLIYLSVIKCEFFEFNLKDNS